ncbi:MAG TPA: A24 family peptidase [Albitalea sp.]|uniref:A24 family peptidase n=1 Tax=Piscinibacter sp. TaxID=1903157 RepID=UPI002ED380B6
MPELLTAIGLCAWLLAAVVTDLRSRRIPNWLVGGGMLCGLAVQAAAPSGMGLFHFWWGGLGIGTALLGLLAGLALFLPLHLLRILGAGDVKLLAMVGVWVGPRLVIGTALLTLLAGGLLAIVMMLGTRTARRVLANVRVLLMTAFVGAQAGKPAPMDIAMTSGVRIPYAIAIAAGAIVQIGWLLTHAGP